MAATGPCRSPDTPKTTSSSNDDSSAKAALACATAAVAAAAASTATAPIVDANDNDNMAPSTSTAQLQPAAAADDDHAPISVNDDDNNNNIIPMPTYHSTKSSKAYTLAKQLLNTGSFDDALATLEMALQFSREIVANYLLDNNKSSSDHDDDEDDDEMNVELHESLAPLYYLYGTTLLYSVEESDVMMTAANSSSSGNAQQQQQQQQQQQGQGGEGAAEEQDYFEVAPEEEEEEENQTPGEYAEDYAEDGEDANAAASSSPTAADTAEDTQIAWENLDLARSIVSRLVEKFPNSYHNAADSSDGATKIILKSNNANPTKSSTTNNNTTSNTYTYTYTYTPEQQTELLLDLAQIHTQRSNDNLLSCIDDYHHALTLRLETLGPYDRKVADSHFSLAAVYAEAPNRMGENEGRVNMFVNSLGGGDEADGSTERKNGDGGGLTEEEKVHFRQRSLEHYLACGVAFTGMLAKMCGVDPEELTTINDTNESTASAVGMASAASAFASAGNTTSSNNSSSVVYTQAMSTLRQRISTLAQSTPSSLTVVLSPEDREEFTNVQEMLDEIQEAMDSAQETEMGLKIMSEMKANEIKKHEMKMNGEEEEVENGGALFGDDGGITTTIGFQVPSGLSNGGAMAAAATTTTTSAAAAPTMMVVKKKKKPLPQSSGEDDSSNKRAKTN
ncbi:hypothetical protein ACHAXH_002090 [Discostella pseudostelligera]